MSGSGNRRNSGGYIGSRSGSGRSSGGYIGARGKSGSSGRKSTAASSRQSSARSRTARAAAARRRAEALEREKKRKRARAAAIVIVTFGLMLVVGGSLVWSYINSKLDLVTRTNPEDFEVVESLDQSVIEEELQYAQEMEAANPGEEPAEPAGTAPTNQGVQPAAQIKSRADVTNFLLVGTDNNSWKNSRSDTMIIVSLNSTTKSVKMTSFMRDTYVGFPDYQGRSYEDQKLTHAFAYGGAGLLMATVERNFGIKIDHYVRVNFASFPKVINAIGGVGLYFTDAEAQYLNSIGYLVPSGNYWADGSTALAYARIRTIDSDYNRTRRQQKLLMSVAHAAKSSSLSQINSTLTEICSMIQTDMSDSEIMSYAASIPSYLGNIDSFEQKTFPLQGEYKGKTINGMWVAVTDMPATAQKIQEYIYG